MKLSIKKIIIGTVIVIIGFGLIRAVYQHKVHNPKNQAVAVSVVPVQQKDVQQTIEAVGVVQALASVAVKSQVSGTLAKVAIQEGKDVNVNDVLFQIDPRPFEIELQQAKAELAKAQAQLDNARSVYARYAKLVNKGFVAQDVFNEAHSNVTALEASVAADEAAVAAAQLKLDYSTIRAPISGRIGLINLHEGNLVKENDTTPLVVINQIKPITISFTIPEQYLPSIQQLLASGTTIALIAKISDNKEMQEQGILVSINNTIDTATGTIQLKGTFANEHNLLWPGQFVTVRMPLKKYPNALVVPSRAIEQGQNGAHVYVIDDKHVAQYRPVQTGVSVDNETVILNGVKPGENVVTDGQFRLAPGKTVILAKPKH